MKRRNAECGKMRRPVKRNKIADGIYGSTLLYLKFLLLWAMIILADFILEFRFEFLWPFWMLLRSVYDSFKYQGLAFSVFFVCIALTSDMICFFFIPVQWVFFAASTYVWVQYVWHTDKGVCLPTVILCSVFVYVEGGVRLRDLRHMPAHVDLCRPFAAHCIGYPVVTLGFGLKSYVGHRMRIRRQKQVAKENAFYMQLLQEALPPSAHMAAIRESCDVSTLVMETPPHPAHTHMNGNSVLHTSGGAPLPSGSTCSISNSNPSYSSKGSRSTKHSNTPQEKGSAGAMGAAPTCASYQPPASSDTPAWSVVSNDVASSQIGGGKASHAASTPSSSAPGRQHSHANGSVGHGGGHAEGPAESEAPSPQSERASKGPKYNPHKSEKKESWSAPKEESRKKNKNKDKDNSGTKDKDVAEVGGSSREREREGRDKERSHRDREAEAQRERESKKERDRDKEKEELQQKHLEHKEACERQIRQLRSEVTQLRSQNEQLNTRANAARAAERAAMSSVERRVTEERRRAEGCRQRRVALETEVSTLRQQLHQARERGQRLERDLQTAEHQVGTLESKLRENGPEAWRTALSSYRDRAQQLERTLSAETKIKMDLFSAVGEAKRLSGLREGVIRSQEKEIEELKGKIAQMLAVMPSDPFPQSSYHMHPHQHSLPSPQAVNPLSNLDPNATAYTPKSINQPTIKG